MKSTSHRGLVVRGLVVRSAAGAAAAALFAGLAPRAAQAQTASPVIWACYVPLTGTIYRIRATNARDDCTSASHIMFSWNQQGVAGAKGDKGDAGLAGINGAKGDKGDKGDIGSAGPRGAQGIQGDKGPQGPQGVQGPQGETGKSAFLDPDGVAIAGVSGAGSGHHTLIAQCPAGTRLIGGGFVLKGLHTPALVGDVEPNFTASTVDPTLPNAWRVQFTQGGLSTSDVEAHAFCFAP